LIEEWAGEGVFEGFGGAVFAVGEAGAEEAAGAGGAEGGHEVVEADVDEAGADDEADDGFDGFADHVVCSGEGFVDALFGEDELAHAVVVEGDECVGEDGEFVEGGFGLFAAAAAFEGEGHGGEDDDEGSFFAGEAGDDGSGSGAGATAEAGAEEDDAAAFEGGADFVFGFEDGLVAEFGIATGAEALGEVAAELDFFVGDAGGEGADVGVEGEEFGTFHAVECDAFEHVGTGSTEADDFDAGGGDGLLWVARIRNHLGGC
jgi:hypothetical protein